MSQAFEITIDFDGTNAIPSLKQLTMNLNDTVRYHCVTGPVRIEFVNKTAATPKSPFSADTDRVVGDGVAVHRARRRQRGTVEGHRAADVADLLGRVLERSARRAALHHEGA